MRKLLTLRLRFSLKEMRFNVLSERDKPRRAYSGRIGTPTTAGNSVTFLVGRNSLNVTVQQTGDEEVTAHIEADHPEDAPPLHLAMAPSGFIRKFVLPEVEGGVAADITFAADTGDGHLIEADLCGVEYDADGNLPRGA
jgi:hypothetical protein